jgi:DNA polymerase-3 subunit beta
MQLVNGSRDALLKPLSIVSGIVERRHTLPILANLLIRKQGRHVSFVSTDQEIQITTHGDFGVGDAVESTTVAARKLLDILRALPDTDVNMTLEARKLGVKAGRSRFALQTLDAADYPVMKEAEQWVASFSLTQKALRNLLNLVHFAMAQQDIRYYLNAMQLAVAGREIRAVATDGHRLAYATIEVDADLAPHDVIIPRKTVMELMRLLEDTDEPVQIDLARNQMRLRFGSVELISKLVEGTYPDCKRVIPRGYTKTFVIEREALQRSLQRAAILTTDKFKGVRMALENHTLRITANNTEQEEVQEELEIEYEHEALDLGFNVSYLLDVLGNLKADKVQLAFGDANSSALLTLPEREDFKYVVMPMRI